MNTNFLFPHILIFIVGCVYAYTIYTLKCNVDTFHREIIDSRDRIHILEEYLKHVMTTIQKN